MELRFFPNSESKMACLRIPVGGHLVTAYLSEATWHAKFGIGDSDASFRERLIVNQPLIDAAVARRYSAGSRDVMVLRSVDF